MSIIYRIELEPAGRVPVDKVRYGLCSYSLVRQSFLARQVLGRLSEWFAVADGGPAAFVLRKDAPLALRWRAAGTSATGVVESNGQMAAALLMLSGREPRDEIAAADQFERLLSDPGGRFGPASSTDVRRFDRRPLLVSVTAPEAVQNEWDLDFLEVCIAAAFFERCGVLQ